MTSDFGKEYIRYGISYETRCLRKDLSSVTVKFRIQEGGGIVGVVLGKTQVFLRPAMCQECLW